MYEATHWGHWWQRTQNWSIQTVTILLGKYAYFSLDFCINIVLYWKDLLERRVLMFCIQRDITLWKSAWMTSAQAKWWRRLHDWADVIHADFQTVISRYLQNINTYLFCTAEIMLWTIITQKFQDDPGMFSYQNRRGLNRPILRSLWLMTSAAADVISVDSVKLGTIGINEGGYQNDVK